MHTFLTQSRYIQIPCTYVLGVTLPKCLLCYHYIWQSCSEVVATFVMHIINQIMNGWRLTESVLYFFSICYVEIQLRRESKFQVLIYIFYLTVICIPLKSHQSNQTRSTTLRSFIDCEYSSYLFLLILWHTTHVFMYV
jgi:hypothetical protein